MGRKPKGPVEGVAIAMSERLDRIEAILERSAVQIESNARAIEANSSAIAELRNSQQDFRASIEDVVGMVTGLAEQAEQDRVEFRDTVQRILDALSQRFSGNGHT